MRRRGLRRRHSGIRGIDGIGPELGQGALALATGAAGYFASTWVSSLLRGSLGVGGRLPVILAGLVGGSLLSRVSPGAGFGLVGGVCGVGLIDTINDVVHMANTSAGTNGVGAYPWTRRYGVHGLRQMDPYAVRMPLQGLGQPKPTYYGWGLGRTRVIEQQPRGYEMNGLGKRGYSYKSSALRMFG
jgi:hypothetical protein